MKKIELEKKISELLNLSVDFADKEKVNETLRECSKEIEYVKEKVEKSRELEGKIRELTLKVNEISGEFQKAFESDELGFDQKLYQMTETTSILSVALKELVKYRNLQKELKEEMHINEIKKKVEILPLWKKILQRYEIDDTEVIAPEQPEATALKKFEEVEEKTENAEEVDKLYNLLEDLNSAPEIIDTDLIEKPKERRFKLFKKR